MTTPQVVSRTSDSFELELPSGCRLLFQDDPCCFRGRWVLESTLGTETDADAHILKRLYPWVLDELYHGKTVDLSREVNWYR